MIPDRLPARASRGEERLFGVLRRLPDDHVVYYEPVIQFRYPDFIVISPKLGLLVIEVKGWYPRDILAADSNSVTVMSDGQPTACKHPLRQAREYFTRLIDVAKRQLPQLVNRSGPHKGRLRFPIGYFAVLSNISRDSFDDAPQIAFDRIFDPKRTVLRDELVAWEEMELGGEPLLNQLKQYVEPWWPFPSLQPKEVDAVRCLIHPEIALELPLFAEPPTQEPEPPAVAAAAGANRDQAKPKPRRASELEGLKALDLRQERLARRIGTGHRVIYGVAGSGKTVLLAGRAKLLAAQCPDARVLLLTYNVALAGMLTAQLKDFPSIIVKTFHTWAGAQGVACDRTKEGEADDDLGERLAQLLDQGKGYSRTLDAVLIDEAQDFAPSWFRCVTLALKDPNDGDLLIVADGSQGLYKRRKFTWKSVGVNAAGRTIHSNFDLDRNYRNTTAILNVAGLFTAKSSPSIEDAILSPKVDPALCRRPGGMVPVLCRCPESDDQVQAVVRTVQGLTKGAFFEETVEPVPLDRIAVLYRAATGARFPALKRLIEDLSELGPVQWLTDPDDHLARKNASAPGVKVTTIYTAKGLQFAAVILIWADDLPLIADTTDEDTERRLMYVALTRAEDYLALTSARPSSFTDLIQTSGLARVLESMPSRVPAKSK